MPRSSKELLAYLFTESQQDNEVDENAGEGVAQSMEELEKELAKVEEFENLEDVMSTDTSKLEPHLKPLIDLLKKIGIENADSRVSNVGTNFTLSTDDEKIHHADLSILQDIEKSEALTSAGFIPLNGESDRDNNGLARYSIVIIK